MTAISARLPLLLSAAVSRGMVFGKGALVPYMMSMQPTDAGDVIMEVPHTHTRVHIPQLLAADRWAQCRLKTAFKLPLYTTLNQPSFNTLI